MKIMDIEAFEDAQSMARIAYYSENKAQAESFWSAAMGALKYAYGVKK